MINWGEIVVSGAINFQKVLMFYAHIHLRDAVLSKRDIIGQATIFMLLYLHVYVLAYDIVVRDE
jgi:hypothetical protein